MLLAIGIFVLVQAVITYQYILILRESNKYQDALDAPFGPITPLNIIPIILSSLISKEKNNRNKIILLLILCFTVGCSETSTSQNTPQEVAEVVEIIEKYIEPPEGTPPISDSEIIQSVILYSQENYNLPDPVVKVQSIEADTATVLIETEVEAGYILYLKKLNNQWVVESEGLYNHSPGV